MTTTVKPEGYRSRVESAGQWKLRVASYQLGDKYVCVVDNFDPGATLTRVEAASREEAEAQALAKARSMVEQTRTFDVQR